MVDQVIPCDYSFKFSFMDMIRQLLRHLAHSGRTTASALARSLGVSQPTTSRLLRDSGDRVIRLGRGPATTWAATRALGRLGSMLPVYRVDAFGHVQHHRTLHLLA